MADGELSLTEREERILELIGQGKADVEVANDLAISFDEAKRGVQSVMRKLGVSTREEAAAKGKRGGRRWLPRMDGLVHWVGDTPSGQATVAGLIGIGIVVVLGLVWFGGGGEESEAGVRVAEIVQSEEGLFTLRVMEVGVEERLLEISPAAEFLVDPRFSRDGAKVAAFLGERADGDELVIRIATFDIALGTIQISQSVSTTGPGGLSWSPDGTRIASSSGELTILDKAANVLVTGDLSAPIPEYAAQPAWSADSEHVAVAVGGDLLLISSRDGPPRRITVDELAAKPPTGANLEAGYDTFRSVEWMDDGRLRLLIDRQQLGTMPADRNPDSGLFQATGFVRGTDIGWSSMEKLTIEEEAAILVDPGVEQMALQAQAMQLVEGSEERYVARFPAWRTADGSAWVQLVPYGERSVRTGLPETARAVVLLDEPVVVEMEDFQSGLLAARPGNFDVVVLR